jgi:GT2 family glycosyltransferase
MGVRYDIVMANYVNDRTLPIVSESLAAIRRCSGSDYRLLLIDNGSPAFDALGPELGLHRNLIVVRNAENLGFVKATNQGIMLSTAERVVLLNNDAVPMAPGWLERLDAALTGTVGIVGPRSQPNGTLSGQMPYLSSTVLPRSSMLVFFCAMLTREVVERVGLLDESLGIGLGDDDDYCYRAQAAGFDLCYLGDLMVWHYHKTTFRQLFTAQQVYAMGHAAKARLVAKGTWRAGA